MTLPCDQPVTYVTGGTKSEDVARLFAHLRFMVEAELGRSTPPCHETEGPGDAPRTASGLPALIVPLGSGEVISDVDKQVRGALATGLPQATQVLLRTSGSTSGRGALVAMSIRALIASAQATHERLGGPGVWLLALPAHHVAGVQILIRSAVAGTCPLILDTSQGFNPLALAATIDRYSAPLPLYVSLVPTQLRRCLDSAQARQALRRAQAILVGGAALDTSLRRRAVQQGLQVVCTYGMSETGGGCIYDGIPLRGIQMRCESSPGESDPGQDSPREGRIILRGPVLAEAVVGGSAAIRTGADGRRELVTNDRGRIMDGHLEVLGRIDDVIITGGIKVEPGDVEAAIGALEGVQDCCVVGVPDDEWGQRVVAAVVMQPGHTGNPEHLQRLARGRLDGAHCPKRILLLEELPMRGIGKIDRRAVADIATRA